MTNDDIRSELEGLRAELAALREMQTAGSKSTEGEGSQTTSRFSEMGKQGMDELSKQLRSVVDTVDSDLRKTSLVTVLLLFVFGFIFGRLLPR